MIKKIGLVLLLTIAAGIILYNWNEYREKSLADVIPLQAGEFTWMGFSENRPMQDDKPFEWGTKDKEPMEELLAFLNQYRVKKKHVGYEALSQEVTALMNSGSAFHFELVRDKAETVLIYANHNTVYVLTDRLYEIKNGPIKREWIGAFNEKYRKIYRDS
ncbi:hypothetical protein [Paenibacillus sp. UNC499MF]|uniref:hypothetical protein n=1 Tax=Paenibacillus sp. UNC499MF TaxID=1502751 RepID=UPI00089F9D8D|nr:hypothetical protein [Paenibacillus sp. UNC499MF]SEF62774.1 hypothetical protein SAMN02799616_00686 [Paenibacillus sp. UNC499MF]